MTQSQACPISGIQRILLATDGSEFSEMALREAMGLARSCGSTLHAICVVEVNPEYSSMAPTIVEKAERDARDLLEMVRQCAQKENVRCETIVHEGEDPAHFIVEEAEKLPADMIIMGKHGRRTKLRKLLIGSVTERVLAHAPCKVLIVPVQGKD